METVLQVVTVHTHRTVSRSPFAGPLRTCGVRTHRGEVKAEHIMFSIGSYLSSVRSREGIRDGSIARQRASLESIGRCLRTRSIYALYIRSRRSATVTSRPFRITGRDEMVMAARVVVRVAVVRLRAKETVEMVRAATRRGW